VGGVHGTFYIQKLQLLILWGGTEQLVLSLFVVVMQGWQSGFGPSQTGVLIVVSDGSGYNEHLVQL
jgi:hypothetical protein